MISPLLVGLLGLFVCGVVECENERFHLGKVLYEATDTLSLLSLRSKSKVEEKWFEQQLDHFAPNDQRTWKQRFHTYSEFFDPTNKDAPVFLEISGEGQASASKFQASNMADNLARQFKAYSIQVEHRFYGKSQPFKDWSAENLLYLTSEQALADLANFIQFMNDTTTELQNRKWIIFGGSYAGALSAWMRLKYPHLVAGSISSSAPVQAQLDFPEYMEVVQQSLGPQCSRQVKIAFEELVNWASASSSTLIKLFNLCDLKITKEKTRKNFFSTIIDQFAGVVQYNEDNRKGNNVTIDMICEIMTQENENGSSNENVIKLSKVYKLINKDQKKCNNVSYEKSVEDLKNITIDFDGAGRQWTYQTCNEFGYYQTTTSENQPFPAGILDLKFFTDMCEDVYGKKFNLDYIKKAIARTNMIYGGRNLKADKVFLINGSIDPWHALSLLNYEYYQTSSYFINGTAHCAEMYPESPNDKPGLSIARELIAKRIATFLKSD